MVTKLSFVVLCRYFKALEAMYEHKKEGLMQEQRVISNEDLRRL